MTKTKFKGIVALAAFSVAASVSVLSAHAASPNTSEDDKYNLEVKIHDYNIENGAERQNLDNYFFGANRGSGRRLYRGQGEVLMDAKVKINDNLRKPYHNAFKPIIPDYYLHGDYTSLMQRYRKEYGRPLNPRVNLSNVWVGQSLDYYGGSGFEREPALSGTYTFSFLGHDTTLKHVDASKEYADLAIWMASGVSEIDGYLTRVISENTKTLRSFKPTKFCSQEDLLELSWRNNLLIDQIHPAIAKVLAKADVSSVHDLNLDLRKYLSGKELVVSDARAKSKLEGILNAAGVNASVVVGRGLIPRTPIDDTYFSVARSEAEMENIFDDYWGYESAVKELYKYRTFGINDVRLSNSKATMAEVIYQKAMKEKSIRDCSLASL